MKIPADFEMSVCNEWLKAAKLKMKFQNDLWALFYTNTRTDLSHPLHMHQDYFMFLHLVTRRENEKVAKHHRYLFLNWQRLSAFQTSKV